MFFFFFNDTATTEIYTLSLHDALPISSVASTGLSAHDFATRLLHEARVAVVPGDAFGPGGAGHVRCAYATSLDQIEEALGRIDRFLSDQIGRASCRERG